MKVNNLIGKRFNKIMVVDKIDNIHWLCKCDCGESNEFIETTSHLIHGYKKSCGCLRKETSKINGCANKKYNKYDLSNDYGVGYTSKGEEFYFDLEDYDKIKGYCWNRSQRYVQTRLDTGEIIMLHKFITNTDKETIIDHNDRNPMNCRKDNLRICSHSENCSNITKRKDNKSGVTGVCWSKKYNSWISYIHKDKKQLLLGRYLNKNDAIVARLKAEKDIFGDFAPQKHLYEKYKI